VVAANELDAIGIPEFKASEEGDRLYAEQSTINVVSKEKIVGVWSIAAYTENLDEIVELAWKFRI